MTQETLEALRKLLPSWEFQMNKSGWLHFWLNGNWTANHNTSDPWDYDHLCGEVERALLAKDDVAWVEVRITDHATLPKEPGCYASIMVYTKGQYRETAADAPDKLTALLIAAT